MQYSIQQYDKLTGLPYYEDFLCLAAEAVQTKLDDDREYVIIATDISNFKLINQICGYEKGDELLKSLVKIFVMDNPYCLCACRPYSDHILGLYVKTCDNELFEKRFTKCLTQFESVNRAQYQSVILHLQNGICTVTDTLLPIVSYVDRANIARRSMKGDYNASYVFFDESMFKGKEKTSEVIRLFDDALSRNDILVYYQPKINVHTKQLEGAEALSRIRLADGSIMMPGDYISVLETSGRIIDLDYYMMRSAFVTIKQLIDSGMTPVTLSVNLSRIHFYNDRLVSEIMSIFRPFNIPAQYIEFEVTESAFLSETGIVSDKLLELKKLGFKVSMDDFGTGYSSLHSLSVLPLDVVKFDRSFIHSSMESDKGRKVLGGLISLCKQIDFDVLCEGVENEVEERVASECGCDCIQGYIYDKPLPSDIFLHKYFCSERTA